MIEEYSVPISRQARKNNIPVAAIAVCRFVNQGAGTSEWADEKQGIFSGVEFGISRVRIPRIFELVSSRPVNHWVTF